MISLSPLGYEGYAVQAAIAYLECSDGQDECLIAGRAELFTLKLVALTCCRDKLRWGKDCVESGRGRVGKESWWSGVSR